MNQRSSDFKMLQGVCFRLLPIQILLALIGSVNGIVSSLFATNFVGADAMSAIGLYAPLGCVFGAVSTMLVGGSQIICGKYMGKNQPEGMQNVFSVNMALTFLFGLLATVVLVAAGLLDLTGGFTSDASVRTHFNRYLVGMALGILPQILGQQLSGFLSLENRTRLTTVAGIAFILANLVLDYLFVVVLRMEAFGLALATTFGLAVFAGVQALYYLRGHSVLKLRFKSIGWNTAGQIIRIGAPGALSCGYQAIRTLIVNMLTLQYVGSLGISAFAAANSFLCLFWAIPGGMSAVSRMLISVSVGEEDRDGLQNTMRILFYRYVPLMLAVAALLIAFAEPMARMYYRDPGDPVYMMTVWGFRILPLSMPLSLICSHFICYAQVSGKKVLMHLLPLVDGLLGAALALALLIPHLGMNSVYLANVINGLITTAIIIVYAWIKNRRFPKTMSALMVIPADFGADPRNRLSITVRSMDEVMELSRQVQRFCLDRGVDGRRSFFAALAIEELAGNIIAHGFTKDRKAHSIDLRVVCKGEELILQIKDDCVPFDPGRRLTRPDPDDPAKNIGIRLIYSIATDIQYQNILGLNALTIRI